MKLRNHPIFDRYTSICTQNNVTHLMGHCIELFSSYHHQENLFKGEILNSR